MYVFPAVSAADTPTKPVQQPRDRRGKASLLTLADLDGRTNAAKQAVALRQAILEDLGGADNLSAIKLALVDAVAVSTAVIEDGMARWLRGEQVDLGPITTLSNSRRRDAQLLGLDRVMRDATDLDSYLKGGAR